ncbi:MAG TPA: flagellin [Verrucomicrobiota bacterium]|nr:flagellin [Verrucomicrobiota bacterium]
MSSGSKIVQPQDDAAGLAQSLKLDSKVRRLDAAISNNINFRSMLQTQDGLAQKMQSAITRMNELAVLYQDVTKTADDKSAYELEFNSLDEGIFDMAGKTFNGVDLFFTEGKVFTGDSGSTTLNENNVADGLGRGANGDYKIEVKFETNASGTELQAKHKALVERAARRVEAIIIGDVSGGQAIDNTITAKLKDSGDGVGNNLASASMQTSWGGSLAASGEMTIDEDDLDSMINNGTAYATYIHEIMHAVGFSSSHTNFNTTTYTAGGTNAIAQYNEIMGTSVTTLNLEDGGGAGTEHSHWEEDDFDNELMTGWVNAGETPLSKVTVGALEDAGYEVDYNAADPWYGPGTGSGPAGGMVIGSVESVKGAIQGLANYRAQIGAQLSYTNKVNGALAIERENMMQATSRIKDVDIAEETTLLAKSQILVRSATAMTSQANVLPEMALMLIR